MSAAITFAAACETREGSVDDDDDGGRDDASRNIASGGAATTTVTTTVTVGGGGDGEDGAELCTNTCAWAYDGECDDGGPGSQYAGCEYGTDCADCGPRSASEGDQVMCAAPSTPCIQDVPEPQFSPGNCCTEFPVQCSPVDGLPRCSLGAGTVGCDEIPCRDGLTCWTIDYVTYSCQFP